MAKTIKLENAIIPERRNFVKIIILNTERQAVFNT